MTGLLMRLVAVTFRFVRGGKIDTCERYGTLLADLSTSSSVSIEELLDADALAASTIAALCERTCPAELDGPEEVRLGDADIAGAQLYLTSDASARVTGTTLVDRASLA